MSAEAGMPVVYVDADACPVKDEVYRVAERHERAVRVVANTPIRVPDSHHVARIVVGAGADAANDWIAERAGPRDVVVTADIPLADRCVKAGATVIAPNGRVFTPETIGAALATRDLLEHLRGAGETTGGPAAFSRRDRSNFLSALHQALVRLARR